MKTTLNEAQNNSLIETDSINYILPKGSTIPRLYGLPKIHKTGNPCPSFLSMVGGVVHNIAKFIAKVLKPIEQYFSSHCFTDSFDLVDKLKHIKHRPENIVFASLEIISRFTNVPVNDVLSVTDSTIQAGAVQVNMDRALLLKLLEICLCRSISFQRYVLQPD